MGRLYALFRDAPTLGSLIDPTRYLEKGEEVGFERVLPLVEKALQEEQRKSDDELAIAAQGVLSSISDFAAQFTFVATNVPYLVRANKIRSREYCEGYS